MLVQHQRPRLGPLVDWYVSGNRYRALQRAACRAACHALALTTLLASCSSSDSVKPSAALELSPKSVSVSVGDAQQFSALNAQGTVAWTSSNASVASVVSTGFTTANRPGSATITATDSRGSASATMTVKVPAALVLSVNALTFAQVLGATDPAAQVIQISDGGEDRVGAVSIVSVVAPAGQNADWLTATLSGTSAPTQLTVRVAAATLVPGIYSATITIRAAGALNGTQSVAVTFTVTAAPAIQLSTSTLAFTLVRNSGAPPAQTVTVINSGGGTLAPLSTTVTYSQGQPSGWLTATLGGSSAPTMIVVQPALGALADGSYSATISVAAAGASNTPRAIAVSFTIVSGASIGLSANTLAFTAVRGAPSASARTITVTNTGGGTLSQLTTAVTYQQGQPSGWLAATLSGSTAPSVITVQPTTGALADGTYNATVSVASGGANNSPQTIAVTLVVVSSPAIGLSSQNVTFASTVGGAVPPAQTINVVNAGGAVLSGLAVGVTYAAGQPAGWLTTATLSQQTAPATLTLRPTIDVLAAGTYTATVSLSSPVANNSPVTIAVTLNVGSAPTLVVGTTALSVSVLRGSSSGPLPVAVTRLGGGLLTGLTATVSPSGAGWLTAAFSASSTPTVVVMTANAASLTPGVYQATVTITSPDATNSPPVINVSLTVLWSFTADIYPQLAPSCTGCHFAGGSSPNLSTAALFYNNLVGIPTTIRLAAYPLATTHPIRIVAGSPSTSYVVDEIRKLPGAFPMPTGATPVVAQSVIDRFIAWISQGALFN